MPSRTESRARGGSQSQPESEQRGLVVFDQKAKAKDLVAALEQRRDQIASFLQVRSPEEADRFLTVAVDAIVRDRNLLQADLLSLVNSIRHAAIMGLEPTSVMGEGAIVVYRDSDQGGKKIAQFQPMVRGLQKLARNSGEVAAIGVDVVRRWDHFVYRSGSDPVIEHEPYIEGLSPVRDETAEGGGNDVIGAYAYVRLRTGELLPMFMSTAEIEKRRSVSKSWRNSGESSIWGKWREEMMKKTVLRRLLQERAPLSFRAQRALALDAEIDSVGGNPEAAEPRVSRSAARLLGELDEPAQDGSGAAPEHEVGADTAPDAGGRPEPSGAATDDDVEDGAVRCGRPGMKEGSSCVREPHDVGPHRDADGDEWLS
jgi:recombination protein RecT